MTETPEYVKPYAGTRKCRYGDHPATWDVAGFLSCSDDDHLGRASDEWVEAKRRELEEAGRPSRPLISQSTLDEIGTCGRCPSPDSPQARARRLLDQYRAYAEDPYSPREWHPDALRPTTWMAEAADLLGRIAGES